MSTQPQITNQPLPADLQSVLNELDRTDQEASQLVSELSETQLNWRSSPTAWSVAQCLDHLGQINSAYVPALQAAVRHAGRNSAAMYEPIQPGWFGREINLNRIRFKNPFVSLLRFTVGTGILIISAHDRRHLWQARQVRASMKADSAGVGGASAG